MTIALYPKREQLETLIAGPPDSPVVMLNLLRFKERATAPDEGVSGQQAYQRYGDARPVSRTSRRKRSSRMVRPSPD